MRSEHRAPLIAALVVVVACAGVLLHAARTDALGGLGRPMRVLAAHLLEPAPGVPVERTVDVAPPAQQPADRSEVQRPVAADVAPADSRAEVVVVAQKPQEPVAPVTDVVSDSHQVESERARPESGRGRSRADEHSRAPERSEHPGRGFARSEERRSARGPEHGHGEHGHGRERSADRGAHSDRHGHGHGHDRGRGDHRSGVRR